MSPGEAGVYFEKEAMAQDYVEERNGGLYIVGTRVSLDSIVEAFRKGMSAESIGEEFETLTPAQVYGALAYYLERREAVEDYRERQERRFAEIRRHAPALPDDLVQRLKAARESLSQAN